MGILSRVCFEISKKFMELPQERTVDYKAYDSWRVDSLSNSWSAFDDALITGKDVLDFGCGDGQLSFFLASKGPMKISGVDINESAIKRAKKTLESFDVPEGCEINFQIGSVSGLPFPDLSFDTIVAFDCMEHVMSPGSILKDWQRVLCPGGRCLIEWYPYKGPWGPHMEALIPIPWSHIIFGENAMFRAAERIYDLPNFVPRHWDIDEHGNKKLNKWKAWSTFEQQGYINKLDIPTFKKLCVQAGFDIERLECHSFSGSHIRQLLGKMLMKIPFIGEYFVSYAIIEIVRPDR